MNKISQKNFNYAYNEANRIIRIKDESFKIGEIKKFISNNMDKDILKLYFSMFLVSLDVNYNTRKQGKFISKLITDGTVEYEVNYSFKDQLFIAIGTLLLYENELTNKKKSSYSYMNSKKYFQDVTYKFNKNEKETFIKYLEKMAESYIGEIEQEIKDDNDLNRYYTAYNLFDDVYERSNIFNKFQQAYGVPYYQDKELATHITSFALENNITKTIALCVLNISLYEKHPELNNAEYDKIKIAEEIFNESNAVSYMIKMANNRFDNIIDATNAKRIETVDAEGGIHRDPALFNHSNNDSIYIEDGNKVVEQSAMEKINAQSAPIQTSGNFINFINPQHEIKNETKAPLSVSNPTAVNITPEKSTYNEPLPLSQMVSNNPQRQVSTISNKEQKEMPVEVRVEPEVVAPPNDLPEIVGKQEEVNFLNPTSPPLSTGDVFESNDLDKNHFIMQDSKVDDNAFKPVFRKLPREARLANFEVDESPEEKEKVKIVITKFETSDFSNNAIYQSKIEKIANEIKMLPELEQKQEAILMVKENLSVAGISETTINNIILNDIIKKNNI